MALMMDEELIPLREAFKPMLGADRKYEKSLYYRHPDVWSPGTPQEQPNPRAGWIIWAGNNRDRMADMMERGFVPLRKFGLASRFAEWEEKAQGTADQYGPWGSILAHPEGPGAFPVSQVMAYRWYDPVHCPVPGVAFPQLAGMDITEYACPDCNHRIFAMALHLARHLRNAHDWTTDDVLKFGEAMGLDFRREFGKQAKVVRTYQPGATAHPARPSGMLAPAIPPVTVERVVPVRSATPEAEPAPAAASGKSRGRGNGSAVQTKTRSPAQLANDAKLKAAAEARRAAKPE